MLFGRGRVQECVINDLTLKVPTDFIKICGHCRVADNPPTYYIETAHLRWAVANLPVGGVAVDIGASGGVFTASFSRKSGPKGRVYAFEPARRARSFLTSLVAKNSLANVTIERAAISDKPSRALFHELPVDDACAWLPEASALELPTQLLQRAAKTYEVPVTTIDDYFGRHAGPINLIKIDIEGFEAHALRGGLKCVSAFRPSLCIDIHNRLDGPGDTEDSVREILSPLGYRFDKLGHVLLASP